VSSVTDVFGQVVSYQYDANSNRTQLSLNAVTNATYQYDVVNRLTQLTYNASLNTTFVYDATNKLTSRTLPNGVVSTYQYDGLDRLTRLTHAKSPNTLLDLQYQFNAVNNITQMIDNAGTHNYSYDSLDRLTAATHPTQPNESYSFDAVGNRTASHQGSNYTYQPFNRLISANGTSFGYDANGNQISKVDGSGSWTYTWDYENRLKQASLFGGGTVNYTYDALDRRVQRSVTAGTTKFVYDGADVLRDLDGNGSTVADYSNDLGIDNKLTETIGGTGFYLATDQVGTTRALTDSTGTLGSSVAYDSYGNIGGSSPSTRYTYTGRESDTDVGLIYYRTRWYDPQQGRFESEDSIGFSGGINLYSYVQNNPINLVDPLGQDGSGPDRTPSRGKRPSRPIIDPPPAPPRPPSTPKPTPTPRTPHGPSGPPSSDCDCFDIPRLPDYATWNSTFPAPTFAPMGGFSVSATVDRNGNLYLNLGGAVGFPSPYGQSLKAGWLNQFCKPTPDVLNDFLTAFGTNATYQWGPATFGESWTPGVGTATEWGVGFNPARAGSVSTGYGWQITKIPYVSW
jgi:RHS repeat-associated protein